MAAKQLESAQTLVVILGSWVGYRVRHKVMVTMPTDMFLSAADHCNYIYVNNEFNL